jgi:hypothetical protein
MSDLLNPANPLNPFSPISPFNPANQPDTPEYHLGVGIGMAVCFIGLFVLACWLVVKGEKR